MKTVTALALTTFTSLASAGVMWGNGTITAEQQQHIDSLPPATPVTSEWCYMVNGSPVNNGICYTKFVAHVDLPAGKRERALAHEIIYLPTLPDVQAACKKEKLVFGCAIETKEKVVIYIYDSPARDRIRTHELEYHVFRDIEH